MKKKHYNILFSIPVHEKPEVVLDMVTNILHFNAESCIVLHISQGFVFDSDYLSEADFLRALDDMTSVIVNPCRLRSGYEDIIQCHISNFRYACQEIEFDYIVFAASNELYVAFGLWDDIKKYDCGPKQRHIINDNTEWIQEKHALEDSEFIRALNNKKISQIYSGQFEGSFMKKDMMQNISDIIESFYDYKSMKIKYAREEIFFHTLIAALYPEAQIRMDNTTYMNWANDLRTSVADVINLLRFGGNKYSLKRVPRLINEEVRTFIRDYVGCYGKDLERYFTNNGKVNNDSSIINLNKKMQLKSSMYKTWIIIKQKCFSVCDYLNRNNYTVVSIYGYGEVGKLLYNELMMGRGVEIESIIDKGNADRTGDVKITEPFPILKKTDLIIVTVLSDEDLMKQLVDKYSIPCIGIYDLFNKIEDDLLYKG